MSPSRPPLPNVAEDRGFLLHAAINQKTVDQIGRCRLNNNLVAHIFYLVQLPLDCSVHRCPSDHRVCRAIRRGLSLVIPKVVRCSDTSGKAAAHADYSNRFSRAFSASLFVNFCAQTLYFIMRIFQCSYTIFMLLFSSSHRLLLSQFETLQFPVEVRGRSLMNSNHLGRLLASRFFCIA